jgi:hypothetical protein
VLTELSDWSVSPDYQNNFYKKMFGRNKAKLEAPQPRVSEVSLNFHQSYRNGMMHDKYTALCVGGEHTRHQTIILSDQQVEDLKHEILKQMNHSELLDAAHKKFFGGMMSAGQNTCAPSAMPTGLGAIAKRK